MPLEISPSGIRQVQQMLNRFGYSAGGLTGRWNPVTARAMSEFQAAHGLEPTGRLTIGSIGALGLWNGLIGNPNGAGNRFALGRQNSAVPPPRGFR
ncbi:MAG TPA: peptidoglycan-binding domain-containing protein [Stellaceae bacterium]|nr:peptidoglycan-binding domain-containing protein [Stellaceae bacterium]